MELGDEPGFFAYLKRSMIEVPSTPLALMLGEMIFKNEGQQAAVDFYNNELNRSASITEMEPLLGLLSTQGDRSIQTLHKVISEILQQHARYQCGNCGFSGSHMHWQCPSCNEWGAIKHT